MNVYGNLPRRNTNRNRFRAPINARVIQMPTGLSLGSMSKRTANSTSAPLETPTNGTSLVFRENGVGGSVVETAWSTKTRSSTTDMQSAVIVALTEGRGTENCEIGLAAIDLNTSTLVLSQISDSHSYLNTLTKINVFDPVEILIPNTFVKNRLIEMIRNHFGDVKITGLPRSLFNNAHGLANIKNFSLASNNSIVLAVEKRYYALASASALMSYCELNLNRYFAKQSMWIEYEESDGYAMIDVNTAQVLELVDSAREELKAKCSSLYDILNYCKTALGRRALRASILQPPSDVSEINARLDCVAELIDKSQLTLDIRLILVKLAHIDQILTLPTVLPSEEYHCSERHLNYLLLLRTFLEIVDPLSELLENVDSPIVKKLLAVVKKPGFRKLKLLVSEVICEDTQPARGQQTAINQRCFAIKTGINRVLDMLRKCYSQRIDEVIEYVKELGFMHNLSLSLGNNVKKGYHIVLTMNAHQRRTLREKNLPPEFIQVDRLSTTFTMKTEDLIDMTDRVNGLMREILQASNIVIGKLLLKVRDYSGLFYKLCDQIAQLDLMQSLAQASTAMHYVRPQFSEYTELKHARHPLLDFSCPVEPTANSIYASDDYNLHVITGPNGSGKSIFIRQMILIQVMAQVGCYVPAELATLRVADTILARMYLEDNPACGASAFSLELKEMEYFLNVATSNTILVIDELCRSTSVEEGAALAMALCEQSMQTQAFIFLTTHFKTMRALYDAYFNVSLWQMETIVKGNGAKTSLDFTYKLIPGVTTVKDYGIFIAKGILTEEMSRYITETHGRIEKDKEVVGRQIGIAEKALRLKHDFQAELDRLNMKRELTINMFHDKLTEYNNEISNLGFVNYGTSEPSPGQQLHNLQIVQDAPSFNNNTQILVATNKSPRGDFFSSATQSFPAPLRDYNTRTVPSKSSRSKTPLSSLNLTSTNPLEQVDCDSSLPTIASADFSIILQQDRTRASTPLPEALSKSGPSRTGESRTSGFQFQPIITNVIQPFGFSPTGFPPFSQPSERKRLDSSSLRSNATIHTIERNLKPKAIAKDTPLDANAMDVDECRFFEFEKSQHEAPSQNENDFEKPCESGFGFGQFKMPQLPSFCGNFSGRSTGLVPSQNDEIEKFLDNSAMDDILEEQLSAVTDQVEESMRHESFTDLPNPTCVPTPITTTSESSKQHVEHINRSTASKHPEVELGQSADGLAAPISPAQISCADFDQSTSWNHANLKEINRETSLLGRSGICNEEVFAKDQQMTQAYRTIPSPFTTPQNSGSNQSALKETSTSNRENFVQNQILANRTSSSSSKQHSTPQRPTPDPVVEDTSSCNSTTSKASTRHSLLASTTVFNQVIVNPTTAVDCSKYREGLLPSEKSLVLTGQVPPADHESQAFDLSILSVNQVPSAQCFETVDDLFLKTQQKEEATQNTASWKNNAKNEKQTTSAVLSLEKSCGDNVGHKFSSAPSNLESKEQQRVQLSLEDEDTLIKSLSDDNASKKATSPASLEATKSDLSEFVSQTIMELVYGHRSQPTPDVSSKQQVQFQSEPIANFDVVSSDTDLFGNNTDDSPMATKSSGLVEEKNHPVIQKRPNKQALPRFRPPKYTKKEIKQALFESDQRLLKSGNVDQYIKNVSNRPTVDQIHRAETLAIFYRTSEGFRAVAPPETRQKRKAKVKTKFCPPWSDRHPPKFDVTLFADKNADKFEEYMCQGEKPEPEVVVTTWADLASGRTGKRSSESSGRVSGIKRTKFSTPYRRSGSAANSTLGIFRNEAVQSDLVTPDVCTPDGYYKQNKQRIEGIMSKYLCREQGEESL